MSEIEHEIRSQPALWRAAGPAAARLAELLPGDGGRIAVIGCGTSWFIAQAAAALWEGAGRGEADAFQASELPLTRRYDAVVAISRSGTTTEVERALQALRGRTPTIAVVGVLGTPIAAAADALVDLSMADERSVVQTRFATTALVLWRLLLGADAEALATAAEAALAAPLPDPASYDQAVFLGRGWTVGLAQEAALKLREAALAWSEAYPALDYRHGPISLADGRSLVWAFGDVEPDLLDDVRRTGAQVVGGDGAEPLGELVRAQRLAVALAGFRGLDPDAPRNLTRSIVLP